jgi:hypothetical protein
MNPRIIQVPATLDSVTRRKDKSVRLSLTTTREISTEEMSVMDSFHQSVGHLLFRENKFDESDVPKYDAHTDLKTPSQRLRAVLFVYWMQTNGDSSRFQEFYNRTIEKYINQVKSSLEDK